jgi:hypothetical protein
VSAFDDLVTDFLRLHWTYNPVDATFAGVALYDGSLPPADAAAGAREAAALRALATRLDALAVPAESGARLDARSMRARIDHVLAALTVRPRLQNPAWYTGEVAFGIISLLLPGAVERDSHALEARLDAVPDFLAAGAERLKGRAVPADWVTRARAEIAAVRRLLANPSPTTAFQAPAGPLHLPAAPLQPPSAGSVASALAALAHFDDALRDVPDADPACGRDYLALLMRDVHGLAETPEQLERAAQAAFEATLARLDEGAARLDPARSWREQMAALSDIGPEPEGVLASYRAWHDRALRDGASLLTPAGDYALDFALLPEWARAVAADLYFLFYRSPPERAPGSGSVYWVAPPAPADPAATRRAHNTAAVKLVHAVHHGSIGHHTQNARARRAPSRIARMAGTDCASGIALLSAGTLVEGWACYAEDLLAEVPDFYTPAERLQLEYFELRNIACCLADIRLHTGAWDLAAMRRFYRDEVDFAPARIWSETTRNSIFPASRLMYWTGSRAIKALRAASKLNTKDFHDALLGFGSVPVAWISAELLA